MTQILVDEELYDALLRLYDKYWNDTATYESDHAEISYISNSDLLDLEDICDEIGQLR